MKQSCLVVDDSATVRRIMRLILESIGVGVEEAEDGREALVSCRQNMPTVVIVDANMPVMDGYEFVSELRRMPGGDHPVVIFCLAEYQVSRVVRALNAGANQYMLKPFQKETLIAIFEGLDQLSLPV